MAPAREIEQLTPQIAFWRNYSAAVKADLFSTALLTPAGTWLIDPIRLDQKALGSLTQRDTIVGIFVTNANHCRASAEFAETFCLPVHMHHEIAGSSDFPGAVKVRDRDAICPDLHAIVIEGAPPGEMALYCAHEGGTMIIGDALINSEPYGFALLPGKYCQDHKTMHQSLGKLLGYSFGRMLFAHGTPLMRDARASLERLLSVKE